MGQIFCSSKRAPEQPSKSGSFDNVTSTRSDGNTMGRARSLTPALYAPRCAERSFLHDGDHKPVKLVVFDLDETLTITTFMSQDGTYTDEQRQWTTMVNFESPWVQGSRVAKLKQLFHELVNSRRQHRVLAILTRNSNPAGVEAVLNLLEAADLRDHFSAVWMMPWRRDLPNGAYQQNGEWRFFDPPVNKIMDYKANALKSIAANTEAWFPQLANAECVIDEVRDLSMENIVLVDDQPSNFQSESGARVLRYCKVARFDSKYYDFGHLEGLGGLGAHDDKDYRLLHDFVEKPWNFKHAPNVTCSEIPSGKISCAPVKLICFGFDETLTLATFKPECPEFLANVAWEPSKRLIGQWTLSDIVKYNFESPWVRGSRRGKLRKMLKKLSSDRTLVVLSWSNQGAVSILNLLKAAKLDMYFEAIWTLPSENELPNGACKLGGKWSTFTPPISALHENKIDVIKHVVDNTPQWLPQLEGVMGEKHEDLLRLSLENILLVDDEQPTHRLESEHIIRQCTVTRYDDIYRDCGLLSQMGGIGAYGDEDYATLVRFVGTPWTFPCANYQCTPVAASSNGSSSRIPTLKREVADSPGDHSVKSERRRGTSSLNFIDVNLNVDLSSDCEDDNIATRADVDSSSLD